MSVVLPLRGVTALSDFRVEKFLQKAAALGLPEVKLKAANFGILSVAKKHLMPRQSKNCKPYWQRKALNKRPKRARACIYFW